MNSSMNDNGYTPFYSLANCLVSMSIVDETSYIYFFPSSTKAGPQRYSCDIVVQ